MEAQPTHNSIEEAMPVSIDHRLMRVLIKLAEDTTLSAKQRLEAASQLAELKRLRPLRTYAKKKTDGLLG